MADEKTGLMDNLEQLTKTTFAERGKQAIAPNPSPPPTQPPRPPPASPSETKPPVEPPKPAAPTDAQQTQSEDEVPAPPSDASPKAKLDWSRATEARKQIKAENKRLKEQIAQSKTDPAIEALRKQNEELQSQLEIVAIERSPKFQAQFANESNAIIAVAKQSLPKIADKVAQILALPPGDYRAAEVESVSSDLSASQAAALNVALLDMDKLNYRKNNILTSQRDVWIREMRENESRRESEAKAQKDLWRQTFDQTLSSAQEHLAIYQKREGDESWNTDVEASIDLAQRVYSGEDMEPVDLAKTALWAAAAPRLLAQNLALLQEIEKLKQQTGAISKATPSPAPGTGPAPSVTPDSKTFIDTVLEQGLKEGFLRTHR